MNITKTSGRMWAAAAEFATALRAELGDAAVTGIKWRRPPRECPPWCGRGHYCTAQHGYPSGEHRTAPASWSTGYGSLVATRVAPITGATNRIEVRTVITLPGGEEAAGALASQLLTGIHLTITTLTTPAPDLAPVAASRLVSAIAAGGRHALPGGTR